MAKRIILVGKVTPEGVTLTTTTESDLWAECVVNLMHDGFTQISVKAEKIKTAVEAKK